MTMHTIFFKENDGVFPDPINGSESEVVCWRGEGSQPQPPPPPPPASYNNHYLQSKIIPALKLSAGRNLDSAVTNESDQDQQVCGKKDATQFTVSPGDGRNGEKDAQSGTISSLQVACMGKLKLGVSQPLICGQYPYNGEQWYGVYSAYGGGGMEGQRVMLPLSTGGDGGPIFVNAKQYNGIMRRRRSRAKAESKIQHMKMMRKPYMHLSRHLHAVRRQRGSGGRFLSHKKGGEKVQDNGSTEFHASQVFQSADGNGGIHSTKAVTSHEVTGYLHHFDFDHRLHPSFLDVGNDYLKV